jgi:acyl-CoA reductase-like NAD-dependent aldehyde dehydrogenase
VLDDTDGRAHVIRSFCSWVGGVDLPAERWVHVVRSSAYLEDPFAAIRLKRELDRGAEPDWMDKRLAGRVAKALPGQWGEALTAASDAGRAWAATPMSRRGEFAAELQQTLIERSAELVDVLVAEGHPRRLAQWEVAGAIQGVERSSLNNLEEMFERRVHSEGREIRLVRKPDGVVCVSPAQNAAAVTSLLGINALLAGNTLVVQAPRSAPLGVFWAWRELVAPLLQGWAPLGVVNVICADSAALIDSWLASPKVDDIFFVGSSERGMRLAQRSLAAGKKAVLELSGNDGVLVWRDAEVELAAKALAECFHGSGQLCMVPKYALVHPRVADHVIARLVENIRDIRAGLPEDPATLLVPVLRTADFAEVLAEALDAGGELVTGGLRVNHQGIPDEAGVFIQPTVVRVPGLEVASTLRAVREETFFPLLPVVVPDDGPDDELLDRMLDFMEDNPYGLRNSLWAQDPEVIETFCQGLRNGGILKANDSHIGSAPHLPTHGGTGLTGGPYGDLSHIAARTSRLQGISIATQVNPRHDVFEHRIARGLPPQITSAVSTTPMALDGE